MEPIRVLLVDDHRIVLEGLRVLLTPLAHVAVVGCASTAAEAHQLARATRPVVVAGAGGAGSGERGGGEAGPGRVRRGAVGNPDAEEGRRADGATKGGGGGDLD